MLAALFVPVLALAGVAGAETAGPIFQVNTYTPGAQNEPVVAGSAAGQFVVAWTDAYARDGSSVGVSARLFDAAGSPLGPEFQVPTQTFAAQSLPAATWLATGGFVIAWTSRESDGADANVFAQRFDGGGVRLGSAFQVNSYTLGAQGDDGLDVAATASGDFLVAWASRGQDADNTGVFAQRFASDGTRVGGELQVNQFTEVHQETPAVAASGGNGDFVVVWKSLQGGYYNDVIGRRVGAGGPVGGEFVVNSFTAGDEGYYVDVAALPDGGFVVAWDGYDRESAHNGAFAQRFDAESAPVGAEFQVNAAPQPLGLYGLSVAAGDEQFLVVFEGTDESYDEILLGRRFSSSGAPLGEEFVVDPEHERVDGPSVAGAAGDRFIVAWGVESIAGDPSDVFGRGYGNLAPPCAGDCDGDRHVTPAELVTSVRIGLDALSLDACANLDTDGDRSVGVVDLVSAVGESLNDCGRAETDGFIRR